MSEAIPPDGDEALALLNVAELFLRQARTRPSATAIIDAGGTTTYAALAGRMAGISQVLRARQTDPEQPVGVLMARSADLIATLLAVMHAGAAYVPLDPGDPAERNRRILESSGCRLVLGEAASFAAMRQALGDSFSQYGRYPDTAIADSGRFPGCEVGNGSVLALRPHLSYRPAPYLHRRRLAVRAPGDSRTRCACRGGLARRHRDPGADQKIARASFRYAPWHDY